MIKLRDYQARAIGAVRAEWVRGNRRVLLSLPTGGGKTEVAIDIGADEIEAGARVLVVVERTVLSGQWRTRFHRHGYHNVGVMQGENTIAIHVRQSSWPLLRRFERAGYPRALVWSLLTSLISGTRRTTRC